MICMIIQVSFRVNWLGASKWLWWIINPTQSAI